MPTLRVYDERLFEPPNSPFAPGDSQIHIVGFVITVGSLFRTIDTEGNYKDFDVALEGTNSTTCCSGSCLQSLSPRSISSDDESSCAGGGTRS